MSAPSETIPAGPIFQKNVVSPFLPVCWQNSAHTPGQLFRGASVGIALPFPPRPVDSRRCAGQRPGVMAKARKVQEPAGTYAASPKPPARPAAPAAKAGPTPGIRYADPAAFRKAADKVFKTHHELFRKLAQ